MRFGPLGLPEILTILVSLLFFLGLFIAVIKYLLRKN